MSDLSVLSKLNLTPEMVWELSYVEFISLLRETNRCPGGKKTIREIAINSFLSDRSTVLEIGCNTGFTSLELARSVGCAVTGVDVEQSAIRVAEEELERDDERVRRLVRFQEGSGYNLPFKDSLFDLVFLGGSLSFMTEKTRTLAECQRVLRPWGIIAAVNLHYSSNPPDELLCRVSEVIGCEIPKWNASEWIELYARDFEIYYSCCHTLDPRSLEDIDQYVGYFLRKDHLIDLGLPVLEQIGARWRQTLMLFNENHKYLSYMVILGRNRIITEEIEFF